ncbi:hypothetical protein [Micromonospora purpureochromogenes]|nr:hypothetical protein [Micromonospora purpureochromogenes]
MVPRTEAGACIPESGQQCACKRYFIGCDPYYCYYSYYKWTYNCYGTCRETQSSC